MENKLKSISLFASGGIGDLALKSCNIEIILSNELLSDRCQVLGFNYPETKVIQGDIWEKKQEIIEQTILTQSQGNTKVKSLYPPSTMTQ